MNPVMNQVSREQALEAGAKLQTNIDWSQIDSRLLQEILKDPVALGREATRFLQNRGRVIGMLTDGIVPPRGGRIHIVSVPVDESRIWKEVVGTAPNTDKDQDVWKVGDQYPPVAGATQTARQAVLVNFGKRIMSEDAIAWGASQKLKPCCCPCSMKKHHGKFLSV